MFNAYAAAQQFIAFVMLAYEVQNYCPVSRAQAELAAFEWEANYHQDMYYDEADQPDEDRFADYNFEPDTAAYDEFDALVQDHEDHEDAERGFLARQLVEFNIATAWDFNGRRFQPYQM